MLDKVVLITGASGGLGTAVTQAFLDAGARVAGVSLAASGPESDRHIEISVNLSSLDVARNTVASVIAKWGRIDVLAHLLGGFAGGKSVADTEDAAFEKMLDMNYRAAFHILRAVLPGMREQNSGRILAIGSRTAVDPKPNIGAYSASKAALVSLIQTVALENKDRHITANVILPSTIDTPANRSAMPKADPSRWVAPAQIASLLLHFAGDDAASISGAVIPVYGGEL